MEQQRRRQRKVNATTGSWLEHAQQSIWPRCEATSATSVAAAETVAEAKIAAEEANVTTVEAAERRIREDISGNQVQQRGLDQRGRNNQLGDGAEQCQWRQQKGRDGSKINSNSVTSSGTEQRKR